MMVKAEITMSKVKLLCLQGTGYYSCNVLTCMLMHHSIKINTGSNVNMPVASVNGYAKIQDRSWYAYIQSMLLQGYDMQFLCMECL